MANLSFCVLDARAEKYAAVPTLAFRLGISETGGEKIHAVLLRCQLQIAPRRRNHSMHEQELLFDLFGEPERWGDTLKPLLWTHSTLIVPAFEGRTEVDLPVACTYDFEVTAAKYLQALEGGEVPLELLFSGTVFAKAENGFRVEQVPWSKEAGWRLPVRLWRELMDRHFPGCAWIRVRHESLDALQRFKAQRALLTWDDTIEMLIDAAAGSVKR
jgi:hypothetical protein